MVELDLMSSCRAEAGLPQMAKGADKDLGYSDSLVDEEDEKDEEDEVGAMGEGGIFEV